MNKDQLIDQCGDAYCNNDYERTIELCDKILKDDSDNQTALGYKAKSLYLLGMLDDALNLLDDAIKSYLDNYHFWYVMAEVLVEKEQYDKAIECFGRVFEIGVSDETSLAFIRMDYETCISLKMDHLIETEKYVGAWKCYNQLLEVRSEVLGPQVRLDRFKKHVARQTTMGKTRQYIVKPSSDGAKAKLIEFLIQNGFECLGESSQTFLIDVIERTCKPSSEDDGTISESKFYDKVNYYPRDQIEYKELHFEDGRLAYVGYTLRNAPYGFGTAYFADGTVYRRGIFDIKGIVQGEEYYPSGRLRFKGQWSLTRGYGPNAPYDGDAYDEEGNLIYSGKFEIKRGGVGWPMIQNPKGFAPEQKDSPKIRGLYL